MALVLVTAPATEPVTLTEAKAHLRVDHTAEDTLITALIVAARRSVESFTQRALVTQTWDYSFDAFPSVAPASFLLPLPPLQSVTSITYKNAAGAPTVIDVADYVVDIASQPGRVAPADGKAWPAGTLYPVGAVTVRFVAGYGAAAAVPQDLKQALFLVLGELYERREEATAATVMTPNVLRSRDLLWPYRDLRF